MDRFARFRPRRLVVPLAGLVLAGLAWLVFTSSNSPPNSGDRVARETNPAASADCPGLLPADATLRRLPSPSAANDLVLPAACPGESSAKAVRSGSSRFSVTIETEEPRLAATPAKDDPAAKAEPGPELTAAGPSAAASPSRERPPGKLPAEVKLPTAAKKPAVPPPAPQQPEPLSPPPGSLLLPAEATAERSEQLENIAQEADRHTRAGFDLANRGAVFAARAEFIAALRLVAQGLDAENRTALHSRAVAAGLTALKEAEDFLPRGAKLEADLDLPVIVAGHRTPVLKDIVPEKLAPLGAMKCYNTFAQEQLAAAAGHEVAGSMALYALGKLHGLLARQKTLEVPAAEPKAMVFFQAALLVYPQNYLAANDLGALLAQCGNYVEARGLLEHSVSLRRDATALGNLAVVYQQLGQRRLAEQVRQQIELARRQEAARLKSRQVAAGGPVRWVDPGTFAQAGGQTADPVPVPLRTAPAAASPAAPAAAGPPATAAAPAKNPALGWLPWPFREKTTTQ